MTNINYQTFIGSEASAPPLSRCLDDADLLDCLGPNRDKFATHVRRLLEDPDPMNRPGVAVATDASGKLLGVKTFTAGRDSIGGGWTAVKFGFGRLGICTDLDHAMARAASASGIGEIYEIPETPEGQSYLDNSPKHEVNAFGVYVRRVDTVAQGK